MTDERQTLLVEIGTEELPPKSLLGLSEALGAQLRQRLTGAELIEPGADLELFATPRRLAVRVAGVARRQPDRLVERRGPALQAAYDQAGTPTKATLGFARACGVEVPDLESLTTDQGAWLIYRQLRSGQAATELLPGFVAESLAALPIARRMRWGDGGSGEFVRPVHWVLALLGTEVLPMRLFGIDAGSSSRGHRFHGGGEVVIANAADYEGALRENFVIASVDERRAIVRQQVTSAAARLGGRAVIADELLDEVVSLVEWPQTIGGGFGADFLEVPQEVLIATMRDHQKYFHCVGDDGALQPHFFTVANIASRDPDQVRLGNERVLRARFSDARFFWRADLRRSLDRMAEALDQLVFHQRLGTVLGKVRRVTALAERLAVSLGCQRVAVSRAAALAKADLVSQVVVEYPALQGVMGEHYARRQGEDPAVAVAIREHYLPRFAGDELPQSDIGRCLALADRLDTLAGIFAIDGPPSADKDPYALRRAAIGIIRIGIECGVDFDLTATVRQALAQLPVEVGSSVAAVLVRFIHDRLRGYFAAAGFKHDEIEAVLALAPARLVDAKRRLEAVAEFRRGPAAPRLSATDKRTRNILGKASGQRLARVDPGLLQEAAERALFSCLVAVHDRIAPLLRDGDYGQAFDVLTELAAPVDRFFDEVMVMAEVPAVRENRLALLEALHTALIGVADLSELQA